MRPHSPRATLNDQTPQERSHEKVQIACAWLAIFGHSTEMLLLRALEIRARGICSRLQRDGLLRRIRVPMSQVAVWALTPTGLRVAELALQREVSYLNHPERLTLSRLVHDLAVQEEAIARLPTDLTGLRRLRADRELRSMAATVRPDLVIRHVDPSGSEVQFAIEVEITAKGTKELRAKMIALLPVLTPKRHWLWIVSDGATVADRYSRLWSEVVEREGEGYHMSKAQLLAACTFVSRSPPKIRGFARHVPQSGSSSGS